VVAVDGAGEGVIDTCFGILLDEDAWLCHNYCTTVCLAANKVKPQMRVR
jgi:hypothetical protein